MSARAACVLCEGDGGHLVVRRGPLRVIRADEPGHPAFYRVVWGEHVAEFSDLAPADRLACLEAVCAVEQALRQTLAPTKVNLASLGNQVPHLHWHVVARFEGDRHFPAPVWAAPLREDDPVRLRALADRLPEVDAAVARAVNSAR